mmetsp:Transcript_48471/g.149750  ORF Transcript_48471/g.149750 Transcript_48471/m.149750 type:complete len:328 (-) Transcript_48471:245-1228(-)
MEACGGSDEPELVPAGTTSDSPGESATFPASELRRHNTRESAWVVLHGFVYDLTDFLEKHPGGGEAITAAAGKDVTLYWSAFHKREWLEQHLSPQWRLGTLDVSHGAEKLEEHTAAAPAAAKVGGDVAYSKTEDPRSLRRRQYMSKPVNPGLTCQVVDTIILLESCPERRVVLLERIVSLVETRGDPNCTDQDGGGGSTPLMLAATLGSDEHVQRLLEASADPLYATERSATALHKFAARPMPDARAPEVLTRLLDAQCSVNAAMKQGRTPLHVAAQWGQADMCRLLLANGAMPRARAGEDGTPADWARTCVTDKRKLTEVLRVLQA